MMKTLLLHLALLMIPLQLAAAQETQDTLAGLPVRSMEVSGIAESQLSPGLRQSIDALVGAPSVQVLARRIEEEQPDFVAVARSVRQPPDGVRVIFLAARIGDAADVDLNVNERYRHGMERVRGRASAGSGTNQSAQANSRAGTHPLRALSEPR